MRVTASIEERHREFFERVREEESATSDAEVVRRCIDRAKEAEERVDELEADVQRLEARVDELTNQLRQANRRNEEVTELVEYVEAEKSLQERRQERESANVLKRAKWWLVGYSEDE